jgi:hypothetical protein
VQSQDGGASFSGLFLFALVLVVVVSIPIVALRVRQAPPTSADVLPIEWLRASRFRRRSPRARPRRQWR